MLELEAELVLRLLFPFRFHKESKLSLGAFPIVPICSRNSVVAFEKLYSRGMLNEKEINSSSHQKAKARLVGFFNLLLQIDRRNRRKSNQGGNFESKQSRNHSN